MTNDSVIEEAAKALTGLTDAEWEIATTEGTDHLTGYFEAAERVLAVFEKAHTKELDTSTEPVKNGADSLHVTPTDDERETLLDAAAENYRPGYQESAHDRDYWEAMAYKDGYHDGLRRTAVQEPQGLDALSRCWRGESPEPQGEPSDAQVRAVWDALGPAVTVAFEYEELRAALRAAGEVK